MSDVIFIAVMLVFFVLCALYVHLCDHLMGSDDLALASQGADAPLDSESPPSTASSAGTVGVVTR